MDYTLDLEHEDCDYIVMRRFLEDEQDLDIDKEYELTYLESIMVAEDESNG